ncbi:MAG: LysR family transcriptional regulator [Leisingera sp.]
MRKHVHMHNLRAKMHVMKDLQWDDMRTILVLVREGTLAAAGAALGISYTTVARRVQRAEAALGRPLFERLADGYVPTGAALAIAGAAERMQQEEDSLLRRFAGEDGGLSGPLTFTAPQLLIQSHLAVVLEEFTRLYPSVELTVKAGYDILDLGRREADIAVRISKDPGSTLVGRRLTEQQRGCFATPELAHKAASQPEEELDWLLYTGQEVPPSAATAIHPRTRIRARFDDMIALMSAAQAGMGVLQMPLFLGRASGLVRLEHIPLAPYAPIWLLSHRDLQHAAKVVALKQLLTRWFRQNRRRFAEA